jgi:hypothetical protein
MDIGLQAWKGKLLPIVVRVHASVAVKSADHEHRKETTRTFAGHVQSHTIALSDHRCMSV